MKLNFFILVITLWITASCAPEKPSLFDQAMNALQAEGYTLSALNAPDMRCLQGMLHDGTVAIFMHLYCAIEDDIDMITITFHVTTHYQQGTNRMLEVLELIDFPHAQLIPEFLSENEDKIASGLQAEKYLGGWRVSASTDMDGSDEYLFLGIRSRTFLDEIGEQ
jgi:hypothetical protein